MKSYTITVNGNVYDVEVEEKGSFSPSIAAAPASVPAAPVAKKASKGAVGSILINAPMPGKILALKVEKGQEVKKGDVILLLEAMKMENEVVAAENGKVVSVNVAAGDMVEVGDLLASLN